MQQRTILYNGKEITVQYDVNRCIHARKCVEGLPDVFDPKQKPWISPDNAPPGNLVDVIETCPTGALHYEMKSSSNRSEKSPSKNRISLQPDGPIYIYGDIEIQDADGNTLLEDTRIALCRCGTAENKPLCDNSHKKINFRAGTEADLTKMPAVPAETQKGRLVLKLMKNGPVLVEGNYTIESETISPHTSSKSIALCRCGESSTKPFCDGTHKTNGFEAL
ncbi:MAG: CDGSH iron-sulfur domain-containing protein [Balneolaceae bacterium]